MTKRGIQSTPAVMLLWLASGCASNPTPNTRSETTGTPAGANDPVEDVTTESTATDGGRTDTQDGVDGTPDGDPSPDGSEPPAPGPGGCESTAVSSGPLEFAKEVVTSERPGAAYLKRVDLNGDGRAEMLLTTLAERCEFTEIVQSYCRAGGIGIAGGGAWIMREQSGAPSGEMGEWEFEKAFDYKAGYGWPNESTLFDFDNDGTQDWVIGWGFLTNNQGGIAWMKGTRDASGSLGFGEVQSAHRIDSGYYHVAAPADLDGDGDTDFVTSWHDGAIGPGSMLEWFENDGIEGEASFTRHEIDAAGGSLLELHDLDGDGDKDIVLPQFFHGESLLWYERTGDSPSTVSWQRHLINNTTGRGFVTQFADVDGDGVEDLIYANHNHQGHPDPDKQTMGVYWWKVPPADEITSLDNWDDYMHVIYEGFEVKANNPDQASAPGMLQVSDLDGDGDVDITISGDGDPGMYVLEHNECDTWRLNQVDTGHENSGSQQHLDLDGDGDTDILWATFGPRLGTSYVLAFLQQ